jgi:hypothetical protein
MYRYPLPLDSLVGRGMYTGVSKVLTRASGHVAQLERLRRSIPISRYLFLLHQAAVTGQLPCLDPNGNPTGEFKEIKAQERINIMTKLLDKAMPDRAEPPPLPEDIVPGAVMTNVADMSTEELEGIIAAEQAKLLEATTNE